MVAHLLDNPGYSYCCAHTPHTSYVNTGWYEGERLHVLRRGWFPSNFVEIEYEPTRACSLREPDLIGTLQFDVPQERRVTGGII